MPSIPQSFSIHTEEHSDIVHWCNEQKANGSLSEEIREAIRHYRDCAQRSDLSPAVIVELRMKSLQTSLDVVSTQLTDIKATLKSGRLSIAQHEPQDRVGSDWDEPSDISSALDSLGT